MSIPDLILGIKSVTPTRIEESRRAEGGELVHFDKEGNIVKNPLWKRLFLSLVILLVALLSFGIGRLTAVGKGEGIKIEYDPSLSQFSVPTTPMKTQTATVINSTSDSSNQPTIASPQPTQAVVASKNSTKYHYLYCPGAKQIKEANKISFQNAQEAEASGYTLAGNCKIR